MHPLTPFIGRQQELIELESAIDDLLSGQGSIYVIEGEPGIGKTRLAREFAARVSSRHAKVLWDFYDGILTDPFNLWPRDHGKNLLMSNNGITCHSYTKLISNQLPQNDEKVNPKPEVHRRESDTLSFEKVTYETLESLADRARHEPFAVVVDDADHADAILFEFIGAVARELPQTMIVLSCNSIASRKSPHLKRFFENVLCKGPRRLQLKRFEGSEFAQILESYAGFRPDMATVDKFKQMSGGNPRLTHLIIDTGLAKNLDIEDGSHLTPFVRMTVEQHLQPLTNKTRSLLRTAATIGDKFELRILERLCDESRAWLSDVLWEAEEAGLIVPIGDRPGSYAFVHTLVRDALRDDLPKRETVRLHNQIGLALLKLHGFEREYLAEIATHLFHGSPDDGTGPQRTLYCERAAQYAESTRDFRTAVRYYRMALATLDPSASEADHRRCDLLLSVGRVQSRSGNLAAAVHSLTSAAELAELNHDAVRFARAALALAGNVWQIALGNQAAPRLKSLLEKSLCMLGNSTEPVVAMVSARLAADLYSRGEAPERQRQLIEQASKIAESSQDLEAQLSILQYRHLILISQPKRCDERLGNAEKILDKASALGSDEDWCMAFLLRQSELLRAGNLMRAEVSIATLSNASRTTGKDLFAEVLSTWATMRALIDGRFDEALRGARRFLNFSERVMPETAVALFLPSAVTALREVDRLNEVAEPAERSVESQPWLVVLRATLASIRLGLGDCEGARSILRALLAQGFEDMERNAFLPLYIATLIELSAELDERSYLGELYEQFLPYESFNIVLSPITFAGPAARYLGILATMQERFADAERHFLYALRLSSRTAARPWIAYTEVDYSRMLLERNGPGDRELAFGFISSALKTARVLNMNNLARRAEALKMWLDSLEPKIPPPQNAGRELSVIMVSDRCAQTQFRPGGTLLPQLTAGHSIEMVAEQCGKLPQGQTNVFRREGDYWTIAFNDKIVRLKHAKGLSMIAWLLGHPRHEFLALSLERLAAGGLPPEGELTAAHFVRELGSRTETDDSGPRLDAQSRSNYKQHLAELYEELAEAKSFNDIGRVSKIEQEIHLLEAEICRGFGLNGRIRKWPSEIERSRVNVTNAVRAIVAKLRQQNPALARYLTNTVRTGRFCSFEPDPLVPADWIV